MCVMYYAKSDVSAVACKNEIRLIGTVVTFCSSTSRAPRFVYMQIVKKSITLWNSTPNDFFSALSMPECWPGTFQDKSDHRRSQINMTFNFKI